MKWMCDAVGNAVTSAFVTPPPTRPDPTRPISVVTAAWGVSITQAQDVKAVERAAAPLGFGATA